LPEAIFKSSEILVISLVLVTHPRWYFTCCQRLQIFCWFYT